MGKRFLWARTFFWDGGEELEQNGRAPQPQVEDVLPWKKLTPLKNSLPWAQSIHHIYILLFLINKAALVLLLQLLVVKYFITQTTKKRKQKNPSPQLRMFTNLWWRTSAVDENLMACYHCICISSISWVFITRLDTSCGQMGRRRRSRDWSKLSAQSIKQFITTADKWIYPTGQLFSIDLRRTLMRDRLSNIDGRPRVYIYTRISLEKAGQQLITLL